MKNFFLEVLQAIPEDKVARIAKQVAKETLMLGKKLGVLTSKSIDKVFDKLLTINKIK